jgi:hypothetical protein
LTTLRNVSDELVNAVFGIDLFMVRDRDGLSAPQIEALEREQHEITARMSSVEYHRLGVDAIRADRLRATAIEHELAACFERWSLLEDKARAASA